MSISSDSVEPVSQFPDVLEPQCLSLRPRPGLRAISHWHEYSLRVLAEEVISLVLPLSIHTDASARITHASTHGHSRWKRLARASEVAKLVTDLLIL